MVEDMENKIRNTLNEIYFGKTKDIVNGFRSIQSTDDQRQQAAMKQDLAAALLRRNVKGDNWEWAISGDESDNYIEVARPLSSGLVSGDGAYSSGRP